MAIRRKIDYSLDIGSNGKTQVVKHGTKEITREGFEYELTVNFELVNENHLVKASKDRTSLFANKPEFIITSETGKMILDWCNSGITENTISVKEMSDKINCALSISELTQLYNDNPTFQDAFRPQFQSKKQELEVLTNPKNFSSNGHSHN